MRREDLTIEAPCTKDWNGMKPADAKKRFCDECKMHVHDLASMTLREAKTLLTSDATEGLCIRYLYDQHGDVVFRDDPRLIRPTALVRAKRLMLGAAAMVLPLSVAACMGAAPPPQVSMGAVACPYPAPTAADADAGAPLATSPDAGER